MKSVSVSTEPFPEPSTTSDLSRRWFVGDEKNISTAVNQGRGPREDESPNIESRLVPQRQSQVSDEYIDEEIDIQEEDCLPDDTKSDYLTAEDSFGRLRKIRKGTKTAELIEKWEQRREDNLRGAQAVAALAQQRSIASYEDI